jgi:AcrR family transcriptional regulator
LLGRSPAATLTLGQVATAAGLAKSGVLRYTGSREALLLLVMYDEHLAWVDALGPALSSLAPRQRPAQAIARTLTRRPVLCDLISASPVLIARLGPGDVATVRDQGADIQRRLGITVRPHLKLSDAQVRLLTAAIHAFIGMSWGWAIPERASRRALIAGFEATVTELLDIFIAGLG